MRIAIFTISNLYPQCYCSLVTPTSGDIPDGITSPTHQQQWHIKLFDKLYSFTMAWKHMRKMSHVISATYKDGIWW